MPIYMDLHKLPEEGDPLSKEQLFEIHSRDLKLQSKYGIKYMVYIANLKARNVFCIIDAPDFESCVAIHQEAHAEGPCHLIEVKGGDFIDFVGDRKNVNEFDMLEVAKGIPDTGYRTIVAVDFISLIDNDTFLLEFRKLVAETNGATYIGKKEKEIVVFRNTAPAVEFAKKLIATYKENKLFPQQELRIGIAAGEPVNIKSDSIYGVALQKASQLCDFLENEGILICSVAGKLMSPVAVSKKNSGLNIKVLLPAEEDFLLLLQEAIAVQEENSSFNMESLMKRIGISQSGLYRRCHSICNSSFVSLLQEKRLRKSFVKLKEQQGNISEIAYECGYQSPSYFTRCFKKRFGIPPTRLAARFPANFQGMNEK